MTLLTRRSVTGFDRTRLVVAAVAFAALGMATGCTSAPSIDDGSPVAQPPPDPSTQPLVGGSTAPATCTVATATPSLPTLQELLAEDRFVPFVVALERSGLDTVIDGLDDVVLLAPTGSAFEIDRHGRRHRLLDADEQPAVCSRR